MDLNGDGVISYVMFKGQEGNAEAEARTQFGVEDADTVLTEAGKPALAYYAGDVDTKYQVDQNGAWSAAAAVAYMDTILAEYSEANGNMVELIIANNDDMALGAIDACLDAGLTAEELPFIVGVDATPPALDAMEEGALKGTVQNDAAGQARALVELACALACGEKPEGVVELTDGKYVWLSYATVTQDNLADFRSP